MNSIRKESRYFKVKGKDEFITSSFEVLHVIRYEILVCVKKYNQLALHYTLKSIVRKRNFNMSNNVTAMHTLYTYAVKFTIDIYPGYKNK